MQKQPDAFIVTVIKEPEKGTTLADVIIGSLGITGLLVLASLVLAAIVAVVRIRWNRRHPMSYGRLPPVSPTIHDEAAPESSQAR